MLHTDSPEAAGPDPDAIPENRSSARRSSRLAGYRPLFVLGLVAVVGGIALAVTVFRPGDTTEASRPFDQLVFVNQDNSRSTLADLRGQPLVVNFFASWCAPCKAEMPAIQAVHEAAGGRVHILGVDADLDEATWRSFVAQTAITYPTVFQPDQSIWRALDLSLMPATVFISPDGQVQFRYTGLMDQQTLRNLIRQHLQVEL